MDYLSKTCPIYTLSVNGWEREYQHDEVSYDEVSDTYCEQYSNLMVKHERDRPAKWWSVAVYETWQVYGGPEEGGWYYTAGELVNHAMVRFFSDYQEAYDYTQELWLWCLDENKNRSDVKVTVKAFTEEMPGATFPKRRPHYS